MVGVSCTISFPDKVQAAYADSLPRMVEVHRTRPRATRA